MPVTESIEAILRVVELGALGVFTYLVIKGFGLIKFIMGQIEKMQQRHADQLAGMLRETNESRDKAANAMGVMSTALTGNSATLRETRSVLERMNAR